DGRLLLGCFSEGLHRYDERGRRLPRLAVAEPCRLVSASFGGERILIGGLKSRLLLVDDKGQTLAETGLGKSSIAPALTALGREAVVARTDGCIVAYGV